MRTTLSILTLIALSMVGCSSGGSSSSTAEASVALGTIEDSDVLIVLPDGRIDHFDSSLQLVGSSNAAPLPGVDCAYGLLQDGDRLVLVENCIVKGSLTQRAVLVYGLDGELIDGDFSDIDCAFNCPVIQFDRDKIPASSFEVHPIEGGVSADYLANTGEELRYLLRLDGFFDGESSTEVTFGGEGVKFETFDNGTARLTGRVTVNSVDRQPVPQDLIDSGAVGPFDVSVLLEESTGPNPDYTYYEIVPVGRELVNINDPFDSVHLITFPLDGHMPFQVGEGANQKTPALGGAGWLNYEHVRSHPDGGYEVIGCLDTHIYASDFLFELVETGVTSD